MICEWGNCQEQESLPTQVSINKGEYRKRFCSEYHAALWLLRETTFDRSPEHINRHMSAMALLEVAYKD